MCIQDEYGQLAAEIEILCREYHRLGAEIEKKEERAEVRTNLGQIWNGIKGRLSLGMPALLIAVMDVYEVTRDEEMLQEVLDVVSWNIEQLEVTGESVKLLAYCYYYVEEEECAMKAKNMLKQLEAVGGKAITEEVRQICQELIGEDF